MSGTGAGGSTAVGGTGGTSRAIVVDKRGEHRLVERQVPEPGTDYQQVIKGLVLLAEVGFDVGNKRRAGR
ncbi:MULTISPECIES: hypothetical protein [Streptomyces]|uniref:hypothetical protein n=1 Tax=Streptomyces TaxID=1883 RepID=UPI001315B763|nr:MULTISPECIES: hypothetical protein [Streptomyces]QGZ52272.1 hypothetical protein GPZ77_31520 [Streptomyces sp. QHH-9511]GGT86594.1 hypothetical protein GCM10010272_34410 [Streptomyces lateritius]